MKYAYKVYVNHIMCTTIELNYSFRIKHVYDVILFCVVQTIVSAKASLNTVLQLLLNNSLYDRKIQGVCL